MAKRLKQFLRLKRGVTLAEIVVSLALFAMIMVLILSVLVVSLQTIANNAQLKAKDAEAAAGVENTFADGVESGQHITQQTGTLEIQFDGFTIHAEGEYVSGTDADSQSQFHYFSPN